MPTDVEKAIIASAVAHGIDPYTALATATIESDLDPRAIGDNGTSFGLFQLHRGGELGALTREEAFDPRTNADVALAVMKTVQREHPAADPGHLAALAQRPARPGPYADHVNAAYQRLCRPAHVRLFRLLQLRAPALRGADVRALQHRLALSPLEGADVFGTRTRDAVRRYQQQHGHLGVDGIVGPHTAVALGWEWAG